MKDLSPCWCCGTIVFAMFLVCFCNLHLNWQTNRAFPSFMIQFGRFCLSFVSFFAELTFAALVCGGMKKHFIQLKTASWGGGDNSLNLNTFGSVPIKDAQTLFSSLWRRHADSTANNPARGEVQALRHANILLATASETWSQWCWWLGEGFLKTYRLQSLVASRKLARKKRLLGQQQRQ